MSDLEAAICNCDDCRKARDAEPATNNDGANTLEVFSTDFGYQDNPNFTTITTYRRIVLSFNGDSGNSPTIPFIQSLMKRYDVPEDAQIQTEMNWTTIDDKDDEIMTPPLISRPRKKYYRITFEFPVTTEKEVTL